MRTFFVVVVLLLITGLVSAAPFPFPGKPGTYGVGGPTLAFDDSFTNDAAGWSLIVDGQSNEACDDNMGNCRHDDAADTLRIMTIPGIAVYDSAAGGQANITSADSWVAFELAGTPVPYYGPALRHKGSDMNSNEYMYIIRESTTGINGELDLRVCDGGNNDSTCSTMITTADIRPGGDLVAGDWFAFKVSGQGDATEFAIWVFVSGSLPSNPCAPGTWPAANYCLSSDNNFSDLADDCTGTTASWGASNGPDDQAGKGFPDSGQMNTGNYYGSNASNTDTARICAGNL